MKWHEASTFWARSHTDGEIHTPTPRRELRTRTRQQKSRRQGKRETSQNAVYNFWRRLFEKHSAIYICDSEKTLFINIVLEYIAEQAIATLTTFCFPLYRIKWWIFACLCRLFPKHSAVGYEAATSTLVLGYYYFLVFLAFVAPKTESTTTTTTTKANGLILSEWCSVAFYIHSSSSSYSKSIHSFFMKNGKKRQKRANHCVSCDFRLFFLIISKEDFSFHSTIFHLSTHLFLCFYSNTTSIHAPVSVCNELSH